MRCAWCEERPVAPPRRRYCSRACWWAAKLAWKRDWWERTYVPTVRDRCGVCGEVVARFGARRYCSEACAREAKRAQEAAWRADPANRAKVRASDRRWKAAHRPAKGAGSRPGADHPWRAAIHAEARAALERRAAREGAA